MTNFINKIFDTNQLNFLKKNFLKPSNQASPNNNDSKLFQRLLVAKNAPYLKNQLELFAKSYPNCSDILVVADYTKETIQSIKAALQLKKETSQEAKVKLIYIVDMSPMDRYYSIGMSSIFAEVLLKNERKSFLNFLRKNDIDLDTISIKVQLVRGKEVMDDIYRFISVRNPDLVLLGKKSYSKLEKYLMKNNELHKEKSKIRHPVIVMP